MAMSDKERKRLERERREHMGMTVMPMEVALVEKVMINMAAMEAGYKDRTEYLLDLVRKDRDASRKDREPCPDCRDRGCFNCCNTEAEIRMRDKVGEMA